MNLKLIFTFILLNFIYQAIAGSGDRCEDPINMECVFVDECKNGEIVEDPNYTTFTIKTSRLEKRFKIDKNCKEPDQVCCRKKADPNPTIAQINHLVELNYENCGRRKLNDQLEVENFEDEIGNRVVNNGSDDDDKDGKNCVVEKFPWTVAIFRIKNSGISKVDSTQYTCGGSLIHPKVVLTSAHNIAPYKISEFFVQTGSCGKENMKESQRFEVEKIVIHPKFLIIIYDFSLLFLKNEVPLNKFAGLICLPPPKFNFDNLKRCYVSGFGIKNSNETVIGSTELRSAKLPIVPFQKCNDALKDHPRSSPGFLLHDSFICAGGEEGVDACKGDGGSPLVCASEDKPDIFFQAGIVSWGYGCGEDGVPGVYANVSLARDWIDSNLSKL